MAHRLAILILFLCAPLFAEWTHAEENAPVFESDIQPFLTEKCGKCHSEKVRKGGLDLSSLRGLLHGGESDETLVADSVDDSLLWALVEAGDMPPEGEPLLNGDELLLLHRWVESGARSNQPQQLTKDQMNQHDVLPIFLLRCTTCHGPRLQEGGLDLRSRAAMLSGGKSGPALVPGDPAASLILQRIESEACPPRELLLKFFVRRPPSSEVDVIRKWIAADAPEVDDVARRCDH